MIESDIPDEFKYFIFFIDSSDFDGNFESIDTKHDIVSSVGCISYPCVSTIHQTIKFLVESDKIQGSDKIIIVSREQALRVMNGVNYNIQKTNMGLD